MKSLRAWTQQKNTAQWMLLRSATSLAGGSLGVAAGSDRQDAPKAAGRPWCKAETRAWYRVAAG